ncbi:uncharacterized protein EDB91DRAFT_1250998 [Suillus paluster]|uniref:uncharacterized protein n=1 Tax=Suillus paluster TaxID=48578 RepID=UPI001B86919C|nr:uncharacterized protein EDB91DRAFT_1250998 [Suillus paluster]KAG1734216.1 hypothetical protein EDB91DRAFT_1250998 [Suillus paluster]
MPPPGPSMSFTSIAISLETRFEQQTLLSDLDEAIELRRAVLAMLPPGHPVRCDSLAGLANGLQDRFQQQGVLYDLQIPATGDPVRLSSAIELDRAALALCPPGHLHRSESLNNFAISLDDRFHQQGFLSDLDEVMELQRVALALRPSGHSDRSASLLHLAISLQCKSHYQGLSTDFDEIFKLYAQLSQVSHAFSRDDIRAAKTALKFLDQYIAILSSSSHHFDVAKGGYLIPCDGRFLMLHPSWRFKECRGIDRGKPCNALAEEFKQFSFRLRNIFYASTEDQSPQVRQLTMQWNNVVSRIRLLS